MEKFKVLITGPVNNDFPSLTKKLSSLQKSKAGPFHVCFCVGPFFGNNSGTASGDSSNGVDGGDGKAVKNEDYRKAKDFLSEGSPIPIYFCDVGLLPPGIDIPSYKLDEEDIKDDAEILLDDDDDEEEDVNDKENAKDKKKVEEDDGEKLLIPKGVVKIAPNVYHLHGISYESSQTADILNIHINNGNDDKNYLTVGFFPPKIRMETPQTSKFESKTSHPSYVGCDVLLTSEWGQGMAGSSCLSNEEKAILQQYNSAGSSTDANADSTLNEVGSFDIAEITSLCRPRYHFAPSVSAIGAGIGNGQASDDTYNASFFLQSSPYKNPPSALSSGVMKNYHTSRFLALCQVVDSKKAKAGGKKKKFIHALGIQPLWTMDRVTATTVPDNVVVVPSPYTDEGYNKDRVNGSSSKNRLQNSVGNIGLSEAQTRRILGEGDTSDQYRWNIRNRKRPLDSSSGMNNIDETNCTLFLHGLHKDVSRGANLNRVTILQAFQSHGCTRVRYPGNDLDMGVHGKIHSYCFLEFPSHNEALQCLTKTSGMVEISGVGLTLKWSSGGNRQKGGRNTIPPPPPPGYTGIMIHNSGPPQKKQRTRPTEAEAADSSTLFIHLKPRSWTPEQCNSSIMQIGEIAQTKLEDTINEDGSSERVTAEQEPALKVTARGLVGKPHCGFMDFASHAAASMALATLTGSTDGGNLLKEINKGEKVLKEAQLWWATTKSNTQQTPGQEHGHKFGKHHFPLDARTDCWFCLASPTCEKHLIVTLYDTCYVTMPKGQLNKHHTLIVSINHSSSDSTDDSKSKNIIGAFLDPNPSVVAEIEDTKDKIRKHANTVLDQDLFVFERAIPTKGGYHAHVNCIPIDRNLGTKIRSTMLSMAAAQSKYGDGFELREIQNPEMSVNTILKNDDELDGYFYAEIPFGPNDVKRYLYKYNAKNTGTKFVPLQFGREVLASVAKNPNLATWKNCVLTKEQEEEYATDFRKSFAN
jgi:hypothetical protein